MPMSNGVGELTANFDEVQDLLKKLRSNLSPEQFEKYVFWIVDHTARKVKPILNSDLPEEYEINKKKWVTDETKKRIMSRSNGMITATVPVQGRKASFGGKHYPAQGGVPGWEAVKYAGNPYPITANIVKGKTARLPKYMSKHGNNAPFINTKAPKLNGVAFVREGPDRFPITPIQALAVAQMPVNRGQEKVSEDVMRELDHQLDHYITSIIEKHWS